MSQNAPVSACGANVAVTFARLEYRPRLEAARREHGRGRVKRNSVNYDSSAEAALNFWIAGFVSRSYGVEGGYR